MRTLYIYLLAVLVSFSAHAQNGISYNCSHIWVAEVSDTAHHIDRSGGLSIGGQDWTPIYEKDTNEYEEGINMVCIRCFIRKKQIIHTFHKKNSDFNLSIDSSSIITLYYDQKDGIIKQEPKNGQYILGVDKKGNIIEVNPQVKKKKR